MRRKLNLIAIVVVVAMLGTLSLPAFASNAAVPAPVVLPNAELVSDEELGSVEGEGLATAIGAAAGAALAAYVSYAASVAWDRWVEGKDTQWNSSEANKSAATAAAGAFVVGLFAPAP